MTDTREAVDRIIKDINNALYRAPGQCIPGVTSAFERWLDSQLVWHVNDGIEVQVYKPLSGRKPLPSEVLT